MCCQSGVKQGTKGDFNRVSEATGHQRKRDPAHGVDGLRERVEPDEGNPAPKQHPP